MKTFLAAALCLAATSASALTVERVRPLGAPSVSGDFFLTYDSAAEQLNADATDFTAFALGVIDSDGAVLASDPLDLLILNPDFSDAASGSLIDAALRPGEIVLLFDSEDLDPADGADWSGLALATFAAPGFDPALGLNTLDGATLTVAGDITAAAVIPLPATAPLLLGGLALVAALRRRRAGG
jgi:hypothetical protein